MDGIKIIRIGNKYLFNFAFFWYYITKLRNENFDVVIDDISKIPLCMPFYIRKKPVIVIVHHLHGKTLFKELPLFMALYVYLMERLLIPIFYRKSIIVAVSESTKNELVEFGIPSRNIHVIYNGIDNGRFGPGDKSDMPLILYFGRVKKYKRLYHLIEAFKYVKEKVPDAKLVIAGKGDNYKELVMISKELGIFNSIDFIGEVSEEDKVKLLQEAWVFVTTSEKEGWGITVVEANACGTPAIAFNVPGLRDSIKDGYNGLLIRDGDTKLLAEKIVEVLRNAKLRKKLERNALKWASKFSWEKSAREFEKILKQTVRK